MIKWFTIHYNANYLQTQVEKMRQIRIQPANIEIPEKNPFVNDKLNRQEQIEVLTSIIESNSGSCVIAVDAAWGNGKTTFLKMWTQYLRSEKFTVVDFNAWVTDYCNTPFIALYTELKNVLGKFVEPEHSNTIFIALYTKLVNVLGKFVEPEHRKTSAKLKAVIEKFIDDAKKVPSNYYISKVNINLPLPISAEVRKKNEKWKDKVISEYEESESLLEEFRCSLQNVAKEIAELDGKPLVIVIDELDRCRPSYAVEFLEITKHIFGIDNIVFVLSINRSQLEHSVKALYGSSFDSKEYLRRFFDLEIALPSPSRDHFIDTILEKTGVTQILKEAKFNHDEIENEIAVYILKYYFNNSNISLRTIEHALHHFSIVVSLIPSNRNIYIVSTVVVLILRTINFDMYYKFINKKVSDLDVMNAISEQYESVNEDDVLSLLAAFPSTIITAVKRENYGIWDTSLRYTPLEEKYSSVNCSIVMELQSKNIEALYSNEVVKQLERFRMKYNNYQTIGFKFAVDRFELLSSELKQKHN